MARTVKEANLKLPKVIEIIGQRGKIDLNGVTVKVGLVQL